MIIILVAIAVTAIIVVAVIVAYRRLGHEVTCEEWSDLTRQIEGARNRWQAPDGVKYEWKQKNDDEE